MEHLVNIMIKAAKDVCGTSQKVIYKCNICNDVFGYEGNLTYHQRVCTGLLSLESDKRRCDKCFKDFTKSHFPSHYIKCQGIKEYKVPRANCPDCGLEMSKDNIHRHQQKHCKARKGWQGRQRKLVNCDKCGELFRPSNIYSHMKACTGYKVAYCT